VIIVETHSMVGSLSNRKAITPERGRLGRIFVQSKVVKCGRGRPRSDAIVSAVASKFQKIARVILSPIFN